MPSLDPQLRAILDAVVRAVNEKDAATFAGFLSEDVVYFGSMVAVNLEGPAEMLGMFQALGGRFPALQVRQGRTFGLGPEVALQIQMVLGEQEVQAVWVFRFNAKQKIERFSAIFDPQPFQLRQGRVPHASELHLGQEPSPPAPDPTLPRLPLPLPLDPEVLAAIQGYVDTFNAGDEEAHMRLFHPQARFFGSLTRIDSVGVETFRGVYRAARETMKVRTLKVHQIYGRRRELVVYLSFAPEGSTEPPAEGLWVFRLNDQGQIERLSTLWDAAYLPRRG